MHTGLKTSGGEGGFEPPIQVLARITVYGTQRSGVCTMISTPQDPVRLGS
jgi:hypothetical protein